MTDHVPAGWPQEVLPPGAPGWQRTAEGWLFDLVPVEYRRYGVLRRHPVILARFAAHHVDAAARGARHGLAVARTELRDVAPPEAVEAAVAAYQREGARLAAISRAVSLVEEALRGREFRRRL
ncbi:MAG: hypothetical protein ACRDPT_12115 [Streptomycetales bacterium]